MNVISFVEQNLPSVWCLFKNWITGKAKEQFLGIPLLKGDDMSEAEVILIGVCTVLKQIKTTESLLLPGCVVF